jgi:hypothetical protein
VVSFLQDFLPNFSWMSLLSHAGYRPRPSHPPRSDHPDRWVFWDEYALWSPWLYTFIQPPSIPSPFILVHILFSNTPVHVLPLT